jgi:hypothetical protein
LHRERKQQLPELELRKNNGERRGYQSKVSFVHTKEAKMTTFRVEAAKGRGVNNPKLNVRKHHWMVLSPLQKISM